MDGVTLLRRAREAGLTGAKDGSGLAAIFEDASVVISIARRYGIRRRRSPII